MFLIPLPSGFLTKLLTVLYPSFRAYYLVSKKLWGVTGSIMAFYLNLVVKPRSSIIELLLPNWTVYHSRINDAW